MKLHRVAAIAAVAATSWAITASAQNSADPEKGFMPVELQCPSGNTGNLTLVLKNHSGESVRIRVVFISGIPEDAYYDYAQRGETYQNHGRFTPRDGGNQAGRNAALMGNAVLMEVCEGSAEVRERYISKLSANSESIRNQSLRTPLR
ncbi:MAG: hypothetical protein EPO55_06815 [Reyranella sp.]|uniref:hypothetical protein n=1 Tax=Reyranella sp. TaxID=1929291 RepID=UPI001225AEF1|nr:hypothetical protein [Reyranella sp.]TAJ41097.1 MAG: hypothetical protein EPO55_06815 [Reyranella sp.]